MTCPLSAHSNKASACWCSFEVETDGEYIRILDVSLEGVKDDASTEETVDEDEDTLYGGPVSS